MPYPTGPAPLGPGAKPAFAYLSPREMVKAQMCRAEESHDRQDARIMASLTVARAQSKHPRRPINPKERMSIIRSWTFDKLPNRGHFPEFGYRWEEAHD